MFVHLGHACFMVLRHYLFHFVQALGHAEFVHFCAIGPLRARWWRRSAGQCGPGGFLVRREFELGFELLHMVLHSQAHRFTVLVLHGVHAGFGGLVFRRAILGAGVTGKQSQCSSGQTSSSEVFHYKVP